MMKCKKWEEYKEYKEYYDFCLSIVKNGFVPDVNGEVIIPYDLKNKNINWPNNDVLSPFINDKYLLIKIPKFYLTKMKLNCEY